MSGFPANGGSAPTSATSANSGASVTGAALVAAAQQKRTSVIRKIVQQTVGESLEHASVPQLQALVSSVETYCATTESLASLGKSLYTSAAVVFVVDELMRIILWNDHAIKVSGFAREEMAGRNLLADVPFLVPPHTVNVLADALARCMQGVPFTGAMLEFTRRDRSKLALLTTCTPLLSNPAGQGMLVIGHDVSLVPAATHAYHSKSLASTPAISDHTPLEHQLPPAELPAAPMAMQPLPVAMASVASSSSVAAGPTSAAVAAAAAAAAGAAQSNAAKIPGWSEIAPHYSIECVLGQGSYGQVVRCKHLPTGEIVAIKKIQNVFSDPIDAKRILRELCIVRQLRHPNIVQIREIIAPRDISHFQDLFVVFEYLPSDLEKLLHSPQFLTAEHLRMQKSSVPSHYQREPLFPGVSCFPLSPGAGQVALPQDSRDQLNTILDVLGTMAEDDIAQIADPDVRTYLRSLPHRPRQNLQEMYPGAEPEAIELLTWMLHMNPLKRATLDEALAHKYLASIRSLEEEIVAPGTIQLDFDEKKMSVQEIRERMAHEIRFYHPEVGPVVAAPHKLQAKRQKRNNNN
ncbi:hypothetical protein PybrP1_004020 [[Pythium] brassicae (nom. inval.)]|nr:hypothetical protein PybrP1_004020 [[Pythium] brassicae (nom. inval.)]